MLPQPPLWLILLAFICALGPLVFVHELGHYHVARLFKIPAEAFSIGFGRELFGWTDKRARAGRSAGSRSAAMSSSSATWARRAIRRPESDVPPRIARPRIPVAPGVAAIPRRARRAGRQFPARDPDFRGLFRASSARQRDQRRRRDRARKRRLPPPGSSRATGSSSIAGRSTPSFEDISHGRHAAPERDRRRRASSATGDAR